ncbi:MAG: hypothetical protein L0Y75_05715, partial [Acidobacteria bacterium]|nr:hypothetical protein [Acidobacteriota bacterium]
MNDQFDTEECEATSVETAEEIFARESVYGEIKRALISRGIPAEEIAFIHDFPNPTSKSRAFADLNAGRIRVMIATTEKIGIGTNVQERLFGLHHVTPTFKPA